MALSSSVVGGFFSVLFFSSGERQVVLRCVGQCFFWHSAEQYRVDCGWWWRRTMVGCRHEERESDEKRRLRQRERNVQTAVSMD